MQVCQNPDIYSLDLLVLKTISKQLEDFKEVDLSSTAQWSNNCH